MSKQKLTILEVHERSGIVRRTGNPWRIHEAQCILEQQDGEGKKSVVVGTINLPEAITRDGVPPSGDYVAEFAFARSMEGRLEPRIVSLAPHGMPVAKPKPGAGVTA
jgi:hypothetical protein